MPKEPKMIFKLFAIFIIDLNKTDRSIIINNKTWLKKINYQKKK